MMRISVMPAPAGIRQDMDAPALPLRQGLIILPGREDLEIPVTSPAAEFSPRFKINQFETIFPRRRISGTQNQAGRMRVPPVAAPGIP